MSEDESQKQQANSLIAEIQNLLTQAQQISSDLGARHQSVSSQITELENQRSALQQVFASIEAIKSEAEGKKNSVDTDVQTITRKIEEFNALKDRLDGISNELQSKQPAIDNKFSEIEAAISQLKTEMGVLKQTIDAELPGFRQRVESEQAALRQGIETEQSNLRKSIETEQTTLRQKLVELSTSFQTKHTEQQELRSKEFSEKIADLQQQTNQRIAEEIKASEVIIAALEKYESQAKQVLGTVVSTSQAGVYKSDALEEGRAKKFFRAWASFFMIFAVLILVGPSIYDIFMKGAPNVVIDWHDWLARLPVSAVLFLPAFYFARESTRHSNNERKSKRREQILSTIDPYLELLASEKREELKAKLAEKIFDPNDHSVSKPSEDEMQGFLANLFAAIKAAARKEN